jgi:hypothetical protein
MANNDPCAKRSVGSMKTHGNGEMAKGLLRRLSRRTVLRGIGGSSLGGLLLATVGRNGAVGAAETATRPGSLVREQAQTMQVKVSRIMTNLHLGPGQSGGWYRYWSPGFRPSIMPWFATIPTQVRDHDQSLEIERVYFVLKGADAGADEGRLEVHIAVRNLSDKEDAYFDVWQGATSSA